MDTRNFTGFPVARVRSRLNKLSRWFRCHPAIRRAVQQVTARAVAHLLAGIICGLTFGMAYRNIQADAQHPLHALIGSEVRHVW